MHVLITGGFGYLGPAVADLLLAGGHHVTVMSRRGTPPGLVQRAVGFVSADVRDRDRVCGVVREGGFDAVCHLAAALKGRDSFADPLTYYDVNVGGTLNLLLALRAAGSAEPARFVFTSTDKVYGSRRAGAVDEETPLAPESPYAESKASAEQLVCAYARTGAIAAVTLRCFNLAGVAGILPDLDPDRIIPNALRAATGAQSHVTINGDGSAVRDFVHVQDAAGAVMLALQAATPGDGQTYNIGSGVGTSMAEILATVEAVTGLPVPVVYAPAQPEPQAIIADISRARTRLGWRPERSTITCMLSEVWRVWPTVAG